MSPMPARTTRRRALLAASAIALVAAPLGSVMAQAWPSKPVAIVVPFPPGGGTDAFARPLFAVLAKQTGRQFVIVARGNSAANPYIQSARLNGQPVPHPRIRFSDIAAGGTLVYEMGPRPNPGLWGLANRDR